MRTKICTKCGVEKSEDDFYMGATSKTGRRADCASCHKKRSRISHLKDKESFVGGVFRVQRPLQDRFILDSF